MTTKTFTTSTQVSLTLRPLKRGEVKELKKTGINLLDLQPKDVDDAIDAVARLALPEDVDAILDDLPYSETVEVFKEIVQMTFGSPEEAKNS